jgi:hypothetical protein
MFGGLGAKHNPPGAIAYFLGRHRPRMRTIQYHWRLDVARPGVSLSS